MAQTPEKRQANAGMKDHRLIQRSNHGFDGLFLYAIMTFETADTRLIDRLCDEQNSLHGMAERARDLRLALT